MGFNLSNIETENPHDQCIESFLQMCIKFNFMAVVEVIWLQNIPTFYMNNVESNFGKP